MSKAEEPIGRVLRASTSGFAAGTRLSQLDAPAFGAVVKVEPRSETREVVYGLLYNIRMDDDPMVRQMVLADSVSEEMIRDQHHHRLVPVEMGVLAVGYRGFDGVIRHVLPPRPPLSLDPVYLCPAGELLEFVSRFDYFRMVLGTSQVPGEQLLAANLLIAAGALPTPEEQYEFLVRAGHEAARLLNNDISSLDNLLRLIYPS